MSPDGDASDAPETAAGPEPGAEADPDGDTDPGADAEPNTDADPDVGELPDWTEDPEPDPPSLGPGPPEVDVPEVETSDALAGDVDPELARTFWRLVLVLDVGLLAVALGAMFVYFRGNWERGLALAGFGVAVLAYGAVQYRRYRADDAAAAASRDPDGPDDPDAPEAGTDSPESAVEDPKG